MLDRDTVYTVEITGKQIRDIEIAAEGVKVRDLETAQRIWSWLDNCYKSVSVAGYDNTEDK